MTDSVQATPAAAPSNTNGAPAAPSNTNGAPAAAPSTVHAGDNFQEFQAQVQARMAAHQKPRNGVMLQTTPPAPTETPAPTPAPSETPPAEQPADQPPSEPTEPANENGQITKEDIELLAKAKQWLAGNEVPEEFMQRLVALKNGDEVEYESLDEVRAGRMRQRDYTRAMQAHLREKQSWQANENAYKAHFDAIFNDENDGAAGGDAMYEIYTRAGKRRQLLALGRRLAREEQAIIDGANGIGYAIMHRLGIQDPNDYRVQQAVNREYERRHADLDREARNRSMAFENEQLRKFATARQKEATDDVHFAAQRKSLEQLRPRAFEALGLNHDDDNHRRQFNIYLGSVIRTEGANRITPEIVMKAARGARQEIELQRKRLDAAARGQPAQKGQPGFQPSVGPSGGAPAGAKPQQWHAESFAEKFKLPRW